MIEKITAKEALQTGMRANALLTEPINMRHARLRIDQNRPRDWKRLDSAMEDLFHADAVIREALLKKGTRTENDGIWVPDPRSYLQVDEPEEVVNQLTDTGIQFLNQQGYQGPGAGQGSYTVATNGLNWIGLTNTAISPSHTDTSLSGEITTNGLSRAQGTVSYVGYSSYQTTVTYTFTATGTQSCQAAALFTLAGPPIAGIMNHELTFTQRSLINGDTLAVTYTITLG
jgi:hypothetical protein